MNTFRILHVDMPVMLETTRIRGLALFQNRKLALPDAIIKATANVMACVLVTRNTKDFDGPDIRVPYMVEVRSAASKATTLFTPANELIATVSYVALPPA